LTDEIDIFNLGLEIAVPSRTEEEEEEEGGRGEGDRMMMMIMMTSAAAEITTTTTYYYLLPPRVVPVLTVELDRHCHPHHQHGGRVRLGPVLTHTSSMNGSYGPDG